MHRQVKGQGGWRHSVHLRIDFVVSDLSSKFSMPSAVQPYSVGIVGSGPNRQFMLERLVLRQDFIADAHGTEAPADGRQDSEATDLLSSARQIIESPRTDVVYFSGPTNLELVSAAVQRRKHIVLAPAAMMLRADDLRRLARAAADQGLVAVVDEPRRWDDDFRAARTVALSGRLGDPLRIRLSILTTALPGEAFANGVLREFGWHWLDQLLTFVNDDLVSARLRRFHSSARSGDAGFLAMMDFARGTSAVIEVQTQSLLSLRTGWLLEGSTGAYRDGRQYTKTLDGEIIDEPVSVSPQANDAFLDALAAAIRSEKADESPPDLYHAARITELIDSLSACELPEHFV